MRVVDDEIGCGDAVDELDDFEVAVGLRRMPLSRFLPKIIG